MSTGPEAELDDLLAGAAGEPLVLANEFAEIEVRLVRTRNGARLLVRAPKTGQWITLCPLELESLTWQTPATFSAMIGKPFAPLFPAEPTAESTGEPTGEDG